MKLVAYITIMLMVMGVAQAITEEQLRVNTFVVKDINNIQTEFIKQVDARDTTYREGFNFGEKINIETTEEFTLIFLGFSLCIFLLPIGYNLIWVKINERKIRDYNTYRTLANK